MAEEKTTDELEPPPSRSPSFEDEGGEDARLLEAGEPSLEDASEERKPAPSQRRGFRLASWTAVASLVIICVLIAIIIVVKSSPISVDRWQLDVQNNDYILDPTWDVHAPLQRRVFSWTIRDHIHNPDGIYRPMILVNNQFPGPLIEANEGDTIVVHIHNQAINATSIHWHGIYQNGTPHMDGTVGVSQCPIPPRGKFTYEFAVYGQSGTYWWHAHHGLRSSDGLHGPLIIHGRNEKHLQQIEYDTDRVVLVSDHYHDLSSALLWQYLKPDMENAEPVPVGGLLNGRSSRSCYDFPDRNCDNSTSNVGIPTFNLAQGKKHRLRFINVGAFAEFELQIDEHELAVTEVDGTDIVPVSYHRLSISPGQRYSIVIDANRTGSQQFWLRARMITWCFDEIPSSLQPDVLGVVRYARGSDMPTSKDWDESLADDCRDMNTSDLRPAEVAPAPAKADAFFYIRSNFEIGAYRLSRGFFNSSSWRPDVRSPSLLRAVDGIRNRNATFINQSVGKAFVNDAAFDTSRELVVQTEGIQTVDILISNFDDGNHPLHLHGHKYFILAQGDGYPPLAHVGDDIILENLGPLYRGLDLSNPLRRDTATVEAYGWILLRFVADHAGAWAFHCHVAWHSEAGLLMQFLTRADELWNLDIPESSLQLCASNGLEKGAGPEDAAYEDLAK